ncbi:MAG: cupredoxin domain-containing protein [Nitrososphaeraceae archaeon]
MFSALKFQRSNEKYFQLNTMSNVLFFSFLIFFLFSCYSHFVHAEDIITIVPGASDSSRYRFFDITEYPISPEKEIKWYNADNILHNIKIMSKDGKTIVAESENIKPKEYFNYEFKEEGEYLFQSSKYPWMNGKIIVTDDIKTIKESLGNDIDLYISWTPSTIKSGEKALFKIIFMDNKSSKNQEHIDYSFIIKDSTADEVLYKNSLTHSAWGIEPASYKFDLIGNFVGEVSIQGILFQPINPEYVEFEIASAQ